MTEGEQNPVSAEDRIVDMIEKADTFLSEVKTLLSHVSAQNTINADKATGFVSAAGISASFASSRLKQALKVYQGYQDNTYTNT